MSTIGADDSLPLRVLTVAAIRQLDEKLTQAVRAKYAEITLVVEEGRLRWIRGPAVSEPVAIDRRSDR